jgi:hypothetical protein
MATRLPNKPWIQERPKYCVSRLRDRETGEVIGQVTYLSNHRYYAQSANGQERVYSHSTLVPTDFPGGLFMACSWVYEKSAPAA